MSHSSGVHPKIGALVSSMERIKAMLLDNNFSGALEAMYLESLGLKKEDQDTEQLTRLTQEISLLDAFENQSQRKNRVLQMRKTYRAWYGDLNTLLWAKDYLVNKKYGVETKLDTTFRGKPWTEDEEKP